MCLDGQEELDWIDFLGDAIIHSCSETFSAISIHDVDGDSNDGDATNRAGQGADRTLVLKGGNVIMLLPPNSRRKPHFDH